MIFFPTHQWNTSNSHKMKENTHLCQVIMTKNWKAVLMHSPAIGLWFYTGASACYSGVLNSSSKRTRSFPPPGSVAHAMCNCCQVSGTTEARTTTHWDFGKHLEGHRAPRAGQARRALVLPHCCPMAPKGQPSSRCHLQARAGTAPSSTRAFFGRGIVWGKQWGGLPVPGDWAGCAGPCQTPQSSPHASPPPAAAPGQAGTLCSSRVTPDTRMGAHKARCRCRQESLNCFGTVQWEGLRTSSQEMHEGCILEQPADQTISHCRF